VGEVERARARGRREGPARRLERRLCGREERRGGGPAHRLERRLCVPAGETATRHPLERSSCSPARLRERSNGGVSSPCLGGGGCRVGRWRL
jgi:hypothetical protein